MNYLLKLLFLILFSFNFIFFSSCDKKPEATASNGLEIEISGWGSRLVHYKIKKLKYSYDHIVIEYDDKHNLENDTIERSTYGAIWYFPKVAGTRALSCNASLNMGLIHCFNCPCWDKDNSFDVPVNIHIIGDKKDLEEIAHRMNFLTR